MRTLLYNVRNWSWRLPVVHESHLYFVLLNQWHLTIITRSTADLEATVTDVDLSSSLFLCLLLPPVRVTELVVTEQHLPQWATNQGRVSHGAPVEICWLHHQTRRRQCTRPRQQIEHSQSVIHSQTVHIPPKNQTRKEMEWRLYLVVFIQGVS